MPKQTGAFGYGLFLNCFNVKWAKPGGGTEAVDHALYLHAPLSSFFLLQSMTATSSYIVNCNVLF